MSTERSTIEAATGAAAGEARPATARRPGDEHADGDRQPHRRRPTSCRSTTAPCAAMDLQADQDRRAGLRADGLRPGVHEHRLVSQLDHLHRRRRRHPAAPRLSDRAAVRALELPRGRLPADQRRAAERSRARRAGCTRSRSTRSCTRTSRTSCRASATTPTRWGCSSPRSARCRPSTRTPTRSTTSASAAMQIIRLLAKMPTLAAFAFRHNMGQPYVYPDNDLNYAGNFLSMMYKMTELKYEPDPRLERALDVLFILHADHEQNASTSAVRSVGSTQVDPYSARRRRGRRAVRTAARRRQRGGAADARADRNGREHPRLPRGRQGRATSA